MKRAHALIHDEEILDVEQIEKKLVAEFGNDVCVYERTCTKYAERTLARRSRERVLDWTKVFRYDANVLCIIIYSRTTRVECTSNFFIISVNLTDIVNIYNNSQVVFFFISEKILH